MIMVGAFSAEDLKEQMLIVLAGKVTIYWKYMTQNENAKHSLMPVAVCFFALK